MHMRLHFDYICLSTLDHMLIYPVFMNQVHLRHSEFMNDIWSPLSEVKVGGLETESWGV